MYKIKRFSIQSGAPNKPGSLSRELKNRAGLGAAVGGLIGTPAGLIGGLNIATEFGGKTGAMAGLGILAGSAAFMTIAGMLTALGADRRRARATKVDMTNLLDKLDESTSQAQREGYASINIWRYIVTDEDPSKHMISMAYEDGCLIIVLNNPSQNVLSSFNRVLESMVATNRKADYVAEETENGYVVKAICPNVDAVGTIINYMIMNERVKINCLTDKKLKY